MIVITNVPLEGNYFARRFSDNRVCLTYYEMVDILTIYNISLENLILRVYILYLYCIKDIEIVFLHVMNQRILLMMKQEDVYMTCVVLKQI